MTSKPPVLLSLEAGKLPFAATALAGNAVPATNPSCSALRQAVSKSPVMRPCQYLRTISYPVEAEEPISAYEFVFTLAVIQRSNQRLDKSCGSIDGAHVAP